MKNDNPICLLSLITTESISSTLKHLSQMGTIEDPVIVKSVTENTFVYVPIPNLNKLKPRSKKDNIPLLSPGKTSNEVLGNDIDTYVYTVGRPYGTLDFIIYSDRVRMDNRKHVTDIYDIPSSSVTKFKVYPIRDLKKIIADPFTVELINYRGTDYVLVRPHCNLDYYLVLATDIVKRHFFE